MSRRTPRKLRGSVEISVKLREPSMILRGLLFFLRADTHHFSSYQISNKYPSRSLAKR